MSYTETIKLVSVTQNGEAWTVLQDIASPKARRETLALLKILELSEQEVVARRVVPARAAIQAMHGCPREK